MAVSKKRSTNSASKSTRSTKASSAKKKAAAAKKKKKSAASKKNGSSRKATPKRTAKVMRKAGAIRKLGTSNAENPFALLSNEELRNLSTREGLIRLLKEKKLDNKEIGRVLRFVEYENDLRQLQVQMVKLQRSVQEQGRRVAIIFEGRDAAGKGGSIRRFIEHLNPRLMRVIALPKPTEVESGQWYFQRYCAALPNPGEICFFDRSWYNRAVVEPVMGFCSKDQYKRFMRQVPEFEHMLYEDGIELVKFWFSISKREQAKRFRDRKENPLKQWKISPVDEQAQARWDDYTKYKERMFSQTHSTFSPWIIVKANSKKRARCESIRYVLNRLPYDGKEEAVTSISPDPSIIRRYHRSVAQIDK